jgi:hypothetical protein
VAKFRLPNLTAASNRDQRSSPTPEPTEEDEFVIIDSDSRDSERPVVRSNRRPSSRERGSSATRPAF